MQRRVDLVRYTPMPSPTKPIVRTGIRSRSTRTPTATRSSGKATPATDIPTGLRRLVLGRDQGRCVRCGRHTAGIPRSTQHRQARGMGGRAGAHTAANLILLCGTATSDCHGWCEDRRNLTEAQRYGWVVSSFAPDPAAIPVLVQWLGWCWPGDEWIPTDDPRRT